MPAGDVDYEARGPGYAAHRRPDPRIAAMIRRALGGARTVLNVGAGAGSYEPDDRVVLAVEPSAVMRAQRPRDAAPCIRGVAEALPLDDGAMDAAMAVLTCHQWPNLAKGLRELRRVARGPVVALHHGEDPQELASGRDVAHDVSKRFDVRVEIGSGGLHGDAHRKSRARTRPPKISRSSALRSWRPRASPLAIATLLLELAVFAAAPVVEASRDVLAVVLGLALDAAPDAGHGLPARERDLLAALFAVGQALAGFSQASHASDLALYRGVDLFLHGPVVGPSARHVTLLAVLVRKT